MGQNQLGWNCYSIRIIFILRDGIEWHEWSILKLFFLEVGSFKPRILGEYIFLPVHGMGQPNEKLFSLISRSWNKNPSNSDSFLHASMFLFFSEKVLHSERWPIPHNFFPTETFCGGFFLPLPRKKFAAPFEPWNKNSWWQVTPPKFNGWTPKKMVVKPRSKSEKHCRNCLCSNIPDAR